MTILPNPTFRVLQFTSYISKLQGSKSQDPNNCQFTVIANGYSNKTEIHGYIYVQHGGGGILRPRNLTPQRLLHLSDVSRRRDTRQEKFFRNGFSIPVTRSYYIN